MIKNYSYGPYNVIKGDKQRIRITEGCPHNCPFCYEPQEIKAFGVPEIKRNIVEISDMNLLCKRGALSLIQSLESERVNNKVVYYDLICGIDYRFLTQEIANALKESRFRKIRLAWDWGFKDQYKISDAVKMLLKAGYKPNKIMFFVICNWKISYEECLRKLDLLKVWGCQISDCWFDNQTSPNIKPIHWKEDQIKDFRRKCRKHNQLVTFKIDPEYKEEK